MKRRLRDERAQCVDHYRPHRQLAGCLGERCLSESLVHQGLEIDDAHQSTSSPRPSLIDWRIARERAGSGLGVLQYPEGATPTDECRPYCGGHERL